MKISISLEITLDELEELLDFDSLMDLSDIDADRNESIIKSDIDINYLNDLLKEIKNDWKSYKKEDVEIEMEMDEEGEREGEICVICGATSPEECDLKAHVDNALGSFDQCEEQEQEKTTEDINRERSGLLDEPWTSLNGDAQAEKRRILDHLAINLYKNWIDSIPNNQFLPPDIRENIKGILKEAYWKTFKYNVTI